MYIKWFYDGNMAVNIVNAQCIPLSDCEKRGADWGRTDRGGPCPTCGMFLCHERKDGLLNDTV